MTNDITRPLALIILDGWGVSPQTERNAIALARTPYYDAVCAKYPQTKLAAAGSRVGLADDAPGNAEVGHLTIGAGRVVQTEVARIATAVASGAFLQNRVLRSALGTASGRKSDVHFIGLVSDGGINSSQETLFELLRMAKREGIENVLVHAILDGRDVQPRTADIYVDALEIKMNDIGIGKIASLCGRFYAMDSGENWERTARAYTMLVHGEGERSFDAVSAIRASFLRGISDEFIAPIVIEKRIDIPLSTVKDGDLVVFFNHKPEEMRQLARSLSVPDTTSAKPVIDTVCLVEYDRDFDLPVAFERPVENNVLARMFEQNGVRNYRITESARSPHVSSYFNCNVAASTSYENHIIVPSAGVQTLETDPESKSFKITDRMLRLIESDSRGFFVVNLPAPDLLAEKGNFEKTVEAVQYVDTCLGGVLEKVSEANGIALITSSHGNCEDMMVAVNGAPNIFPTTNPVPFHLIDPMASGIRLSDNGSLEDVAPTILGLLGIEKPPEMTGRDLRLK
jgi:2,3-bisphosphoglycerate-independent phosphoglycerate mutase